mgnify:FL=1
MGTISPKTFYRTFAVSFLAFLFMEGCSPTPRAPEGILDTPAHHVSSGFKFLQKGYNADARREFELALQLDPFYSGAHRGLGLAYGKEKEFSSASDSMCRARDDASTGEQKALAYVGFMRLYTMREKTGWLEQVEERFRDALQWKNDLPEAYFYMGVAYKKANRYTEAEQSFNQVLKINQGLVMEARKELASLHNSVK